MLARVVKIACSRVPATLEQASGMDFMDGMSMASPAPAPAAFDPSAANLASPKEGEDDGACAPLNTTLDITI